MAFKWTVAPSDVLPQGYQKYTQAVYVTGNRVAESRAQKMLAWAKANHTWQNQTGAAEAGLNVDVNQAPGVVASITLAHGVDYGIWLEVANQGRFGVISMSIDTWGPIFMRDMQNMMNLGLVTRGED